MRKIGEGFLLYANKLMLFIFIFIILFNFFTSHSANADITRSSRYSALVLNSENGEILYSKSANELRYPASLTKMMTVFLTFEALENGKIHLDQKVTTSHNAAKQVPSKLGLIPGEEITIRDCIYSAIILSANDAVVVLAEAIAGNETNFARMMNNKAKSLHMHKTNFVNPHGLHHDQQYTTAEDMAKLALALRNKFPKYYPLFSKHSFTYKGKVIHTHNHVNKRYQGAEGLKTGYIRTSGFNLVTTAKQHHGHLVGVVFGGQTAKLRDDHMITILNSDFCQLSSRNGINEPHCKNNPQLLSGNNIKSNINNKPALVTASTRNKNIFHVVDKPLKRIASAQTNKNSTSKAKRVVTSSSINKKKYSTKPKKVLDKNIHKTDKKVTL